MDERRNNETPKLSNYSLIGNSHSAALVCKNGSIEWCCLPEFHSSSVFASLLDREKGGFFSITPITNYQSDQNYIPDTNVVETHFKTSEGEVKLTDAFTVMKEEDKKYSLFPEHEIIRVLEGISGSVKVKLQYAPKIFYGEKAPRLEDRRKLGIHFTWKENIYTLLSTLEPQQIKTIDDQIAIAEFIVNAGERILFSFCYSNQNPAVLPELKLTGYKRMENTIRFWKEWIGKCKYSGLYQEHVRRSALTLKLLAHAPSGAIIAAPTTSLPEKIGGIRNWDYRYCWLRDASFTVRALLELGYEEEASAYMDWILHATHLTRPKLQVVYSVYGNASLEELTLDWLEGYKNSSPVRIGNKADSQFQLDVYGEVLDAIYAYSPLVKEFDRSTKKFIIGLGEVICQVWEQPDDGIWEVRSGRVHHTHSKVMAWVGLNRLIKLCEKYNWKEADIEKYKKTELHISTEVEQYGFNDELKSYTRELNGDTLDVSLLTLSLVGYCNADSPRMISTCEMIYEHLSKNDMLYRYRNTNDGLPGDEGAFGIGNFWLVENMARSGKLTEAVRLFEKLLQHSSPTGLWSEEIDPDTYDLLGNYPQSFTHIGLIKAAIAIDEAYRKKKN